MAGQKDIIPGVSLITIGEARGHKTLEGDPVFVDQTTLEQMLALSRNSKQGVKVKADHGGGVFAVIGRAKNLTIDGGQLRGDLHVFKNARERDLLFEMAEEFPEEFGASAAFNGPYDFSDGKAFARCSELFSFDIVDLPAANPAGLFERGDQKEENFDSAPLDMDEEKVKELITELMAPITEKLSAFEERFSALESIPDANPDEKPKEEYADEKPEAFGKEEMKRVFYETLREYSQSLGIAKSHSPAPSAPPVEQGPKKTFSSVVAEKVAGGMSKPEAIRFCVGAYPDLHKFARENGELKTI